MKTVLAFAALGLAALGLAGAAISPAMAAEMQKTTIRVTTTDIDLGTANGQKTLDKRVDKAVRQVCRTTSPVASGKRAQASAGRVPSRSIRRFTHRLAGSRNSLAASVAAFWSSLQPSPLASAR